MAAELYDDFSGDLSKWVLYSPVAEGFEPPEIEDGSLHITWPEFSGTAITATARRRVDVGPGSEVVLEFETALQGEAIPVGYTEPFSVNETFSDSSYTTRWGIYGSLLNQSVTGGKLSFAPYAGNTGIYYPLTNNYYFKGIQMEGLDLSVEVGSWVLGSGFNMFFTFASDPGLQIYGTEGGLYGHLISLNPITNAGTSHGVYNPTTQKFLRLQIISGQTKYYASPDGTTWTLLRTSTETLPDVMVSGVYVYASGNEDPLSIDNVKLNGSIIYPAGRDYLAYPLYLISGYLNVFVTREADNLMGHINGTSVSVPYDPVNHKWLRYRNVDDIISLETSPDSSSWTTLLEASEAHDTVEGGATLQILGAAGGYSSPIAPGAGDLYVDNVYATPKAFPKFDTLIDTFSHLTLDTDIWVSSGKGAVEIVNGRAKLDGGARITTVRTYDLKDSHVFLEAEVLVTGFEFSIRSYDYQDAVSFNVSTISLMMLYETRDESNLYVSGSFEIEYHPKNHRWLQLRQTSDGLVHYETSPDKTIWTEQYVTPFPPYLSDAYCNIGEIS